MDSLIDWENFRDTLNKARSGERKSNAGRKPFDAVMMFKGLVIQHLYNFSDEQLEFQIRDRFTFLRFLGLTPESRIPDGNTFWDFREKLIKADLIETLFMDFELYLIDKGYVTEKGSIVDASFIEATIQRNSRTENTDIKAGNTPNAFNDSQARKSQKDVDAKRTKKITKNTMGIKTISALIIKKN